MVVSSINFFNDIHFFICFLAAPRPILGFYRGGDSLTHPILIATFVRFWPKGHREPRKVVESLRSAERLMGFEQGTTGS